MTALQWSELLPYRRIRLEKTRLASPEVKPRHPQEVAEQALTDDLLNTLFRAHGRVDTRKTISMMQGTDKKAQAV